MAGDLGFKAGPIEGPTHFSQFEPLGLATFGNEWWRSGCISAHFRNMVVEGERCRAFLKPRHGDADLADIRMEKEDGTEVLQGTASVRGAGGTALRERLSSLRPLERKVILRDVEVGMIRGREPASMAMDQNMGGLYPFTLRQKLDAITETSPPFTAEQPVIPMEMISVLAHYLPKGFPVRGPAIGLFADLEIRLIDGPLIAGEAFEVEKEVMAMSGSRRTESVWIESRIYRPGAATPAAIVLLNSATLKDSFAGYREEEAQLEGDEGQAQDPV
jgi:hypothetical protein